jgi:hypothetical protein
MALNASAVYATYPDGVALDEVLQTLERGGLDKESICMVLSPTHPIAAIVRESSTRSFEREENAVTTGWIGWLSELGAVVIPTFGFFIRSREFFHPLVVQRDSFAPCSGNGTLAALGFSPEDAERFEGQVDEGSAFLYVSCPETETQWALELLRAAGADESGLLESESAVETAA